MESLFDDNAEFYKFFHQFHAPLVLFTFRIVNDQAAAEDIVEDAFVVLWDKRKSLSNIKSLKSYLYTIARNRALYWIRQNKRHVQQCEISAYFNETSERTALDNLVYAETMAGIYAAMDRLPRQCKKVFILHYIEGKNMKEIAEELKITVGTVKTHKVRGIALMQKGLLGLIAGMSMLLNLTTTFYL